jgi:hypothetical protein
MIVSRVFLGVSLVAACPSWASEVSVPQIREGARAELGRVGGSLAVPIALSAVGPSPAALAASASLNTAQIMQVGVNNQATMMQIGGGNYGAIVQQGAGNVAIVSQTNRR